MKRTLFALALLLGGMVPVGATPYGVEADFTQNPISENEYYTFHSMGCMLLQECTAGVVEITSEQDIRDYYNGYKDLPQEFTDLLVTFKQIGIKVYLAPERYFDRNTRGIYHTVSNNFYLNDKFMQKPHILMSVIGHEGWHAAQDCMAGTIDNTFIAVIKNDEEIPQLWKDMAADIYPPTVLPWEQEATWAGREEGMTLEALQACAAGEMWKVYEPTPLTRKYLVEKGYLSK